MEILINGGKKMFGVELLDHIVIGDGRYESIFSWEKKGLWKLK